MISGGRGLSQGRRLDRVFPSSVLVLALAVGSFGCTSQQQSASHSATSRDKPNVDDCFTGKLRLNFMPTSARVGQLVMARSNAPRGPWAVTIDSFGLFGIARNNRFTGLYYVTALTRHRYPRKNPNIRINPSESIAGTGLPNQPFYVEVPHVRPGSYQVRFTYSVSPAGAKVTGMRAGSYSLCALLSVH
jgi:hypothetical protein